jgi:tetratricopeptide (TPR) repeat protein
MNEENHYSDIEEKVYRLVERRRFDQAEALIGTALRNNPENRTLLYYSAYIYSEQERYEDAESTLKKLLGQEPDNFAAGFLLASVYKDLKRYAEAEDLIIELIRQNPESSDCYRLYAEIMLETLYVKKAEKLAAEAVRIEPDNISAQAVAVICNVIKGDKAEYQQSLAELVRNYPEAFTTSSMILVVLYEQKKHREALRIAQELLRCDPNNEFLVEMIKELRISTHVTMIPLLPIIKYGWHASAVLYIIGIVGCYTASKYLPREASSLIISGWLLYVIYSWIYPPILRKILG